MVDESIPSAGSSAPSPARLRAEARKQKILSKGNDRLAKITGAMKSSHYNSQPESANKNQQAATLDSDEPPEVDISTLDLPQNQRSNLSQQAKNVSSSSAYNIESSTNEGTNKKSVKQSQSAISSDRPLIDTSVPPNAADPMLQMMKAMGLELPSGSDLNGMFGSDKPPNPMMQQAFASMNGMQQPNVKTWIDRIMPFLNILTVIGLILSAILWWNPTSNYWRQIHSFRSSDDTNLKIDLKAEWDALHPAGSTPAVRQALGPAPVFWMFVTVELGLQVTKWMLNRGTVAPPGLLNTLIYSLPRPYSTIASTALKYFAIVSSLIDDLCILVFGVGCAVIWLEWKHLPDHSLFDLLKPN